MHPKKTKLKHLKRMKTKKVSRNALGGRSLFQIMPTEHTLFLRAANHLKLPPPGEQVSFKVVWKKNNYNVTFPLDQKALKLKEHIQTLTGSYLYIISHCTRSIDIHILSNRNPSCYDEANV